MKKALVGITAAMSLAACTSVETATVASADVAANGEAVAVIQATSIGITAIFHIVEIVQSDLDTVVNKLLVSEAKAMGASKVDLKFAVQVPRHGIFALFGGILSFPPAVATGIAVK